MAIRSISTIITVDEVLRLIRTGDYRLASWVDFHGSQHRASRYWLERRQIGPDGEMEWLRCPGTHELLRLASRQLRARFNAREGITIYQ